MTVDIRTGLLSSLEYTQKNKMIGELKFNFLKYLLTHPDGRRLEIVLDWQVCFKDVIGITFSQKVKQVLFDKLNATTNADKVYYLFEIGDVLYVIPFNRDYIEKSVTLTSKDFMKMLSDEGVVPVTLIRLSSFWNSPVSSPD